MNKQSASSVVGPRNSHNPNFLNGHYDSIETMTANATMLTEFDNASNVSNATTIFDGDSSEVIEELRSFRRSINKDRRLLVEEYARLQKLDEIDQESDGLAYDDWREKWFISVGKYVESAKDKYADRS